MSSVPPNSNEYPRIFEYAEALQHPHHCFRDPELKASKTDNDARGEPLPRVGGNAAVFKLMNGPKSMAVKVFKHGHDERERRYQIVNDYLATLKSPHLVGFRFQQEGIRVGRRWYPILIMDWVEGLRLTDQVAAWIGQDNKQALLHLANHWEGLIRHLKSNRISHGDLQHGNVLVVRQDLVLVDYDGMCVPALEGHEAWESGLPGYQHPHREGQHLSLQMDDFSAWIIWIALRALLADPLLWKRHVEATGNENLLFNDNDISKPHKSVFWPELLRSPDAEVARRAEKVRDSIFKAFHEIPIFSLDPWSELRERVLQNPRDHEQIARSADAGEQHGQTVPADLVVVVNESRRRIASRRKLEAAVATRDPYTIAQAYQPDLVDDWLEEQVLAEAKKAQPRISVIESLRSALARNDGNTVVELWDRHRTLLDGIPPALEIGKHADRWRSFRALRAVMQNPRATAWSIADAWKALQAVGGHPEAEPFRNLADQALQRADCLDELRRVPVEASEEADRLFLAAWKEALTGWWEAEDYRFRLQAVQSRVAILTDLDEALQAAEPERALEIAGRLKPPIYRQNADRVKRLDSLRKGMQLREELRRALAAVPLLDVPLAEAWEAFSQAGLLLAERSEREQCELAVRRRDGLATFRSISASLPIHQQDGEVLLCWREGDLSGCNDVRPEERERYDEARKRADRWVELQDAIRRSDADAIIRLASDPLLSDYIAPLRRGGDIDAIIRRSKRIGALLNFLTTAGSGGGGADLDLSCVADDPSRFAPHRRRLVAILRDEANRVVLRPRGTPEVLPDVQEGLSAGTLWNAVADSRDLPAVVLSQEGWSAVPRWGGWSWRRLGLGERTCVVATDTLAFPQQPPESGRGPGGAARGDLSPRKTDTASYTLSLGENAYGKRGGLVLPVPADVPRLFVTVWPVLRLPALGLEQYGRPLFIGPIERPESRAVKAGRRAAGNRLLPLALALLVSVCLGLRGWADIKAGQQPVPEPKDLPPLAAPLKITRATPTLQRDIKDALIAMNKGEVIQVSDAKIVSALQLESELREESRGFIAAYLEGCDDKGEFKTSPANVKCELMKKALTEQQQRVKAALSDYDPEQQLKPILVQWLSDCKALLWGKPLPRFVDPQVEVAKKARDEVDKLVNDRLIAPRIRQKLKRLQKWAKVCELMGDLNGAYDRTKGPSKEGTPTIQEQMKALDGVCALLGDWMDGRVVAREMMKGQSGLHENLPLDSWVILIDAKGREIWVEREPVMIVLKSKDGKNSPPPVSLAKYKEFKFSDPEQRTMVLAEIKTEEKFNYDIELDGFWKSAKGGHFTMVKPTWWSTAAHEYAEAYRQLFDQWSVKALLQLHKTCIDYSESKDDQARSLEDEKTKVSPFVELAKAYPKLFEPIN